MATEVERLIVRLIGDGSSFQTMVNTIQGQTKRLGQKLTGLGKTLSTRVTLPLSVMGGAAVKAFADFDHAMTESTSIMKVTEQQIAQMREQAISLSGQATQGPAELARSYFFLASAGKDAEQSMALLPQVSKFATAGAFDMALATDLLTDAQSALGLSSQDAATDMKNLTRISDVFVKSNTLANTSVQQLAEAFTNTAGASLKNFNKTVEEGAAVLSAYADQGIKGNVAGTNLTRVINLLAKSSRDAAKAHSELGFRVFDANGKMRNFADIIQNLEDITRGMSDETKSATLEQLGFQARVQQAVLPLLGTSNAIRRYQTELEKAGGITDDVAEKQMKSFTNQMKVLKNQMTTVAIEIGRALAPVLLRLNELIKAGVQWWGTLDGSTKTVIVTVGALAAALGPVLITLGFMITSIGAVAGVMGTMGTAAVAAATSIGTMTASLTAAKVGVLGLKFALVGLVGYIAFKVTDAIVGATKDLEEFNRVQAESRTFNDRINARFNKETSNILAEIGTAQTAKGRKFLIEEQINRATKAVSGLKVQQELAAKQVEKHNTLVNRLGGNKLLEQAQDNYKDTAFAIKLANERVALLREELAKATKEIQGGAKPVAEAIGLQPNAPSQPVPATPSATAKAVAGGGGSKGQSAIERVALGIARLVQLAEAEAEREGVILEPVGL